MVKLYRQMVVVLMLCALAVGQASAELRLEASYWSMTPSGDLEVGSDGQEGTKADLKDDLGYDSAEGVGLFNLVLGETHQLALSYMHFDISAKNHIDRDIRFQDKDYHAESDLSTELDATIIGAAYRFVAGNDDFKAGFLVGGLYFDLSAQADASGFGSADENAQVGMPQIGGLLIIDSFEYITILASVAGGSWDYDNVSATYIDAELSIRFYLPAGIIAGGGYRNLSVDLEEDDTPVDANITFSGPVAFAGVIF